jgi:hypothetical protein
MAAPVLLKMQASDLSMASGLVAFVYGTMVFFSYPGDEDEKRLRFWRRALLIASIALAAVFLSLTKSEVVPLRGLGAGAAVACAVPGLLAPWSMGFGSTITRWRVFGMPDRAPNWRHVWLSVFMAPVFAGIFFAEFSKPSADNDVTKTFGKWSEPALAIRFLDRRFGGSDYLTIVANGDFNHPGFLRALDDVSVAVRGVPGVESVVSPTDVFKMVSEAMIGRYRIPDTISQMQALWFFLEGQAELSALLYQKDQGLIQIRLSPDGAGRSAEVMEAIRKLMAAIPNRVGHADLRIVSEPDAARLRDRQLARVEKELSKLLGPAAQTDDARRRITRTLESVSPLELKPVSKSPDEQIENAFRTRFAVDLSERLGRYFGSGSSPVEMASAQVAEVVRAIAANQLLEIRFPEQAHENAKFIESLMDKARDAQEKVLVQLLLDELKAAGVAGAEYLAVRAELAGVVRDFASPHVFVDADRDKIKTESVTEAKLELSGYPAIAPWVATATYLDVLRLLKWAVIVCVLVIALSLSVFRERARRLMDSCALVPLSGLSWAAVGLLPAGWALSVSMFASLTVTLAASAGAILIGTSSQTKFRELRWAMMFTGAPLLALFFGFQPVRATMEMTAFGIFGAWFGATMLNTSFDARNRAEKEEKQ